MKIVSKSPNDVPGWDELAQKHSVYSSAGWLSFTDATAHSDARYLAAGEPGTPDLLLPAHWPPEQPSLRYHPPNPDTLVLGGLRGNRSEVIASPDVGTAALGELICAAVRQFPAAGGWWWPHLSSSDAQLVAGIGAPYVSLQGADCVIDVPPDGLPELVDGLPARQRRTNARRELRAFQQGPFRIERTTLAGNAELLGPLLAQLNRRYGHDSDDEAMIRALRGQERFLGERSVVFLTRDQSSQKVAGFVLAYVWGAELAVRVAGFDYEHFDVAGLYPELCVYEPVRYCAEYGLQTIHLGMSSFAAKLRRGARARPLWAVASHPAPVRGPETALEALTADFPERERQLLADEVRDFAQSW